MHVTGISEDGQKGHPRDEGCSIICVLYNPMLIMAASLEMADKHGKLGSEPRKRVEGVKP